MLCGENDFERTRRLKQLQRQFDGVSERYDGADLSSEELADIFAGQTLFSRKRLVIIDDLSANAELWKAINDWAERLSPDTDVVLVEQKPDKRTASYKWLKKHASVEEFALLTERDTGALLAWMEVYGSANGVALTTAQSKRLIARGGANQSVLAQAIDKLSLAGEVTDAWIDDVIEASPSENVFTLFETALQGDKNRISELVRSLQQTEDAYRLFGLLNSQLIQLVMLIHSNTDVAKVAADTGAKSSYPLQKMAPQARRLGTAHAAQLIELFASADMRLKSSDADPWLLLETTLIQMSSIAND